MIFERTGYLHHLQPHSEIFRMPPVLSKKQYNRIKRFLPVARHGAQVDHMYAISGMIYIFKNGVHWRHLPEIYGKWNTVYTLFRRWSKKGVFRMIFDALNSKLKKRHIAMIDSTVSKAHRTAASLKRDGKPRQIGRSKGGLTTKIHLLCNSNGLPLDYRITEGQVSDTKAGVQLLNQNLCRMTHLLGDKAYDSDEIRDLLGKNGVKACIPPKANRKEQLPCDKHLYRERHVIENMFSKLKDWRGGVAFRCHRNAHTFNSLVCIALIFIFF